MNVISLKPPILRYYVRVLDTTDCVSIIVTDIDNNNSNSSINGFVITQNSHCPLFLPFQSFTSSTSYVPFHNDSIMFYVGV